MAATQVPALDYGAKIVEPTTGRLTPYGDAFLRSLLRRTGDADDKIEAAHALASAAAETRLAAAEGATEDGG